MHTRIALYKRSEWYCLCRKCFVRREIVIELRAVDVHHGLRSDRNPIRGKLWRLAGFAEGRSQRTLGTADDQVMLGCRYGARGTGIGCHRHQTGAGRCAGHYWPWSDDSDVWWKILGDGDAVESDPLHFLHKRCYGGGCFVTCWRRRWWIAIITGHCRLYTKRTQTETIVFLI